MLWSVADLKGFVIAAKDGPAGHVADLLFDDRDAAIIALVADIGSALTGREVLVEPTAIDRFDADRRTCLVKIDRAALQHCPDLDADPPVHRRQEKILAAALSLPTRTSALSLSLTGPAPLGMPEVGIETDAQQAEALAEAIRKERKADRHIRSGNEIIGYDAVANDGPVGRISDVLAGLDLRFVHYLVVTLEPRSLPPTKVLLPAATVGEYSWAGRIVHISLRNEEIRAAPPFDRDSMVPAGDEREIYRMYHGGPFAP